MTGGEREIAEALGAPGPEVGTPVNNWRTVTGTTRVPAERYPTTNGGYPARDDS